MSCCERARMCWVLAALLVTPQWSISDDAIRLTLDGRRKLSPAYLPDGKSIAFSVLESPNAVVIKTLDLATREETRLFPSDTAHQFDVAFSRDGRYRSYCRSAGVRQLLLVVKDAQNAEKETTFLPPGSSRSTLRSLRFTPDGRRIVFTLSGDRGLQIASIAPDATGLTYLTESEGTNYWPDVSPDGKRVAFASSRNGAYDIYVMGIDGSNVTRLTNNPTRDIRPAWSPDGSQIAFTSARDGNYEVYLMKADGSDLHRITNHADHDDFPIWQPDGKKLLTVAERDGQSDLYLVDVPTIVP